MGGTVNLSEARKRKEKERYAALVIRAWEDFDHEDKREQLERRADVERAARERL